MVAHPRAADGADRLRPLKRPRPIGVRVDGQGSPLAVRTTAGWIAVRERLEHWRLEDEWWREQPIVRWYYRLALADGRSLTLFHDRLAGRWYQQEYGR